MITTVARIVLSALISARDARNDSPSSSVICHKEVMGGGVL